MLYNNKQVICFIGPRGSGKDWNAGILERSGHVRLSLADPVRDIAWTLLNWKPKNNEEYETFKSDIFLQERWDETNHKPLILSRNKGRDLLINIGNGLREKLGDDIWIDQLIKKIKQSDKTEFVISDVRYANEAIKLSEVFNVKLIFTNYNSDRYDLIRVPSEILNYELHQLGFVDGQEIPLKTIYELKNKFGEI